MNYINKTIQSKISNLLYPNKKSIKEQIDYVFNKAQLDIDFQLKAELINILKQKELYQTKNPPDISINHNYFIQIHNKVNNNIDPALEHINVFRQYENAYDYYKRQFQFLILLNQDFNDYFDEIIKIIKQDPDPELIESLNKNDFFTNQEKKEAINEFILELIKEVKLNTNKGEKIFQILSPTIKEQKLEQNFDLSRSQQLIMAQEIFNKKITKQRVFNIEDLDSPELYFILIDEESYYEHSFNKTIDLIEKTYNRLLEKILDFRKSNRKLGINSVPISDIKLEKIRKIKRDLNLMFYTQKIIKALSNDKNANIEHYIQKLAEKEAILVDITTIQDAKNCRNLVSQEYKSKAQKIIIEKNINKFNTPSNKKRKIL